MHKALQISSLSELKCRTFGGIDHPHLERKRIQAELIFKWLV